MTPTLHEKIFRDFFVSKKFILYSFVIHNQKKKKRLIPISFMIADAKILII